MRLPNPAPRRCLGKWEDVDEQQAERGPPCRTAQDRAGVRVLHDHGQRLTVVDAGHLVIEGIQARTKGEALIASSLDNAAEECFAAAIRVAREQGALLWELRASVRLAGLWCGCSRLNDACNLLRPVYDRFREGLHSRDLRAARAMLEAVEA